MSLQNGEVCVCGMICTEYWEIERVANSREKAMWKDGEYIHKYIVYRCDDCYNRYGDREPTRNYRISRVEIRDGTPLRTGVYDPDRGSDVLKTWR